MDFPVFELSSYLSTPMYGNTVAIAPKRSSTVHHWAVPTAQLSAWPSSPAHWAPAPWGRSKKSNEHPNASYQRLTLLKITVERSNLIGLRLKQDTITSWSQYQGLLVHDPVPRPILFTQTLHLFAIIPIHCNRLHL